MAKLDHETRIKHSNLMRAFCYDSTEEKEVMPWETMIWSSKWEELSEFLCDKDSIYGETWDDYEKLMLQFQEVQNSFPWMKKAYYHYIQENKNRFGIEKSVSGCAGKAVLIVGVLIAVSVFLVKFL